MNILSTFIRFEETKSGQDLKFGTCPIFHLKKSIYQLNVSKLIHMTGNMKPQEKFILVASVPLGILASFDAPIESDYSTRH